MFVRIERTNHDWFKMHFSFANKEFKKPTYCYNSNCWSIIHSEKYVFHFTSSQPHIPSDNIHSSFNFYISIVFSKTFFIHIFKSCIWHHRLSLFELQKNNRNCPFETNPNFQFACNVYLSDKQLTNKSGYSQLTSAPTSVRYTNQPTINHHVNVTSSQTVNRSQ